MGQTYSSGYCEEMTQAGENGTAVLFSYVIASLPPLILLLFPLLLIRLPAHANEKLVKAVRMLDFRPMFRPLDFDVILPLANESTNFKSSDARRRRKLVYQTPRTIAGGLITIMLAIICISAAYFNYYATLSPKKQIPVVNSTIICTSF